MPRGGATPTFAAVKAEIVFVRRLPLLARLANLDLNLVFVEIAHFLAGRRVQPRLDHLGGAPHVGVGIENSYTIAHGIRPLPRPRCTSQPRLFDGTAFPNNALHKSAY